MDTHKSFWRTFHQVTRDDRNVIKRIVTKRLGAFEEAKDVDYMTDGCIANIEGILKQQITQTPIGLFNNKERQRKLAAFEADTDYVRSYVLEATKSFCRKKREYWTHGRNKARKELGEKHKELKIGRAARLHEKENNGDVSKLLDTAARNGLRITALNEDTIRGIESLLKRVRANEAEMRCFWERIDGTTFVEMAEGDANPSATPDKYRKRFKRLTKRLERYNEDFRDLILSNS